jgi:hypothetical protein
MEEPRSFELLGEEEGREETGEIMSGLLADADGGGEAGPK